MLESLRASVARMMDVSEKSYMVWVRTVPTPSRPQDATTCVSAFKEIDGKLKELEQICDSLAEKKEGLFQAGGMKLKPWANEEFSYVEDTLADTLHLKEELQSLKEEIVSTQAKLAERDRFEIASTEM